ncbi:Cox15p [Rhodotorula paludigena]|uniref:Cox15p n=1 Tax=Rhodotorula paludigena TaxID=86838 RepID=UPI0031782D63
MASPWRPLVSLLAPSSRLVLAARPPAAHPAPLARTLATAARHNAPALSRRTTPRSIDAARGFSSSLRTEAKAVAGLGKRLTDSPVALLRRRVVLASRSLSTATAIPLHADSASSSASTTYPDPPEEPLTTPGVSRYLFGIAALVFTIVVVGGMTRLTESGLSITEWNVIKGVQLPLSSAEWNEEFEKYKLTPEFRINNSHMTVDDFKKIYMWEWGHRILGRIIGLTFLAPIPYFLYTRKLGRGVPLALLGIATLIGGQGALGWYMVKSGLDEESVKDLGGVPRVSQYRLAAHLGMAFLVYASCLRLGFGVGRDWKLAKKAQGLAGIKSVQDTLAVLQGKVAGRTRALVTVVSALVFTTALSGAFVAGLDAGLIYNEWPTMGGSLHPPASELNKDFYCRKADKSDRWRNLFENPATAQFDHRMLAYTTFLSVVTLFAYARRPHIRAQLPPTTYRLIKASLHMSVLQVALGISTLLYLVPTHLAATHQAGSLVLLSLVLAAGASLRRPNSRVVSEAMRTLRMRDKAAQIKV